MIFDYNQYRSGSLVTPIIIGMVFLILFIIIIIKIMRLPIEKDKITIKNILVIIIFLLIILDSCLRLRYGIYLLYENKNQFTTISGRIDEIDNVFQSPRYYYNDEPVHASIVTIDGKKLYFMTRGNLKVGDYIEVEYLPKSTFVLKVELLHDSN